jgi:hypothetical protein
MDQPYSFWADLLNKFHTSSDWIQALWLITVPTLIFGVAWCVMRLVCAIAFGLLSRRNPAPGCLICRVHEDAEGRYLICRCEREAEASIRGT